MKFLILIALLFSQTSFADQIIDPEVLRAPTLNPKNPQLPLIYFAPIPAGEFVMGSPLTEAGRDDDEDQVFVKLTRSYEIGMTEITQFQWVTLMGFNPSRFRDSKRCPTSYMEIDGISLCADYPVENISWNDTQDYIKKYNAKAKDGYIYRLPTEAEWEYATRAGTKTAYFFGDDISIADKYALGNLQAVALKLPNPWGLYDALGNVTERVFDWYSERKSGPLVDPTGPSHGTLRVYRGGNWISDMSFLRSASRGGWNPDEGGTFGLTGFRLARVKK